MVQWCLINISGANMKNFSLLLITILTVVFLTNCIQPDSETAPDERAMVRFTHNFDSDLYMNLLDKDTSTDVFTQTILVPKGDISDYYLIREGSYFMKYSDDNKEFTKSASFTDLEKKKKYKISILEENFGVVIQNDPE